MTRVLQLRRGTATQHQNFVGLMCGAEQYWVNNKNTGAITNVTDENWCVLFRVYC